MSVWLAGLSVTVADYLSALLWWIIICADSCLFLGWFDCVCGCLSWLFAVDFLVCLVE